MATTHISSSSSQNDTPSQMPLRKRRYSIGAQFSLGIGTSLKQAPSTQKRIRRPTDSLACSTQVTFNITVKGLCSGLAWLFICSSFDHSKQKKRNEKL